MALRNTDGLMSALHVPTIAAVLRHLRKEKDAKGFMSVLDFSLKSGILTEVQAALLAKGDVR